jgi:ADP-ribose pyrophosphatase YjhB (NUDIX family)
MKSHAGRMKSHAGRMKPCAGRMKRRARAIRRLLVSGERGQVVKAMAVIRRPRDGALLVSEDCDPAGVLFHRPLGGHVELGEYAEHTVRRELLEEIGQRLSEVRLLGVLENIFDWAGSLAHEIVFVFSASFQDDSAYDIAEQRILDHAADDEALVRWRDAEAVSPPLYPAGVGDLIQAALMAKQPG